MMKQFGKKESAAFIFLASLILWGVMTWMISGFRLVRGTGDAAQVSFLFAFIYLAVMMWMGMTRKDTVPKLGFILLFAAVAMIARIMMLDYNSADYDSFLSGWIEAFRKGGFRMLGENVGDYNLLYQYVLLLISFSPLPDLYLIKLFTILFDFLLALAMMRAAHVFAGERAELPVFLIMLILPTTLIEGAFWGQCDSVYAFFVIMSLCDLKTGHPWRSAAFLSVAFAFKLQTIFVFPVVLLGLIHREYRLRHALAFFCMYFVTLIPALCAGRSLVDAVSVYANQSMGQYYHRLTYNAPNLYIFFPMLEFANTQEYTWMRFIEGINNKAQNKYLNMDLFPQLQHAALYACIILVVIAVIYWLVHAKDIRPDMTLQFALFFAIFLPFVMPKIHDRYFYLADIMSILYAFRYKERAYVPALVICASFMSYMVFLTRQRPMDERVLALMMFAALIVVTRDLLTGMRKNRQTIEVAGVC